MPGTALWPLRRRAPSRRLLRLLLWLRAGVRRRTPSIAFEPLIEIGLTIKYTPTVSEENRSSARHSILFEGTRTHAHINCRLLSCHQIATFRHSGFPLSVGFAVRIEVRSGGGHASTGRAPRRAVSTRRWARPLEQTNRYVANERRKLRLTKCRDTARRGQARPLGRLRQGANARADATVRPWDGNQRPRRASAHDGAGERMVAACPVQRTQRSAGRSTRDATVAAGTARGVDRRSLRIAVQGALIRLEFARGARGGLVEQRAVAQRIERVVARRHEGD